MEAAAAGDLQASEQTGPMCRSMLKQAALVKPRPCNSLSSAPRLLPLEVELHMEIGAIFIPEAFAAARGSGLV